MWVHVLMRQDLADSALRDPRQAHMPRLRSLLAGMLVAASSRAHADCQFLGLLAGQGSKPHACFRGDLRCPDAGCRRVPQSLRTWWHAAGSAELFGALRPLHGPTA
jgi:hypothetical protein